TRQRQITGRIPGTPRRGSRSCAVRNVGERGSRSAVQDAGMKLGLFSINIGPRSHPDHLAEAAKTAEDAGFESVWTGEHVVLPDPQVPPSPMAPQDRALDPLLALTWAAAATSTLRLATGIIIL